MKSRLRARWVWFWLAAYVALMVIVIWSLVSTRERVLVEMATPESLADWQAWRNDVQEQQQTTGPVERRVPKSAEPPMLVLLRDHFGVMMVGAILFTTVLYAVMAWFVAGALASRTEHAERQLRSKSQ